MDTTHVSLVALVVVATVACGEPAGTRCRGACDQGPGSGGSASVGGAGGEGATGGRDDGGGGGGGARAAPVQLAKHTDSVFLFPGSLVVDGTHVYWATNDSIWTVPKDGGPSTQLVPHQYGITDLVVDPMHVYWARAFAPYGGVHRSTLDGMSSIGMGPNQLTYALERSGDLVYYTEYAERLAVMPASGGASTVLVDASVIDVAIDSTHAYWTTGPGDVMRMPLAGGAHEKLGDGAYYRLLLAAGYVYWPTVGGTVTRVPIGGGPPEQVLTGVDFVTLAADDVYLYATDAGSCAPSVACAGILRIAHAGGAVETVLDDRLFLANIALDATSMYWLESDSDPEMYYVMKAPKP